MVTVWESKCLKNEPAHQIQLCMLLDSLYNYTCIIGLVLLSTFVLSVCALTVLTVPQEEPQEGRPQDLGVRWVHTPPDVLRNLVRLDLHVNQPYGYRSTHSKSIEMVCTKVCSYCAINLFFFINFQHLCVISDAPMQIDPVHISET